MEKKIERRCNAAILESRASGDSRRVEGYAAVYESRSEDLGFTEIICRGAFDGVIERSDVFALLNHDKSRGVLARSKYGKGTLSLVVDDNGLLYSFDAPNTALGDETLESVRRGDIDSSSFAFTVSKDRWEKQADGSYIRYIDEVERLFDVSPVYQPAYEATTCDTRGRDELIAEEQRAAAEAAAAAKAKAEADERMAIAEILMRI
jgi:HK97 family phage prohead protease